MAAGALGGDDVAAAHGAAALPRVAVVAVEAGEAVGQRRHACAVNDTFEGADGIDEIDESVQDGMADGIEESSVFGSI